MINNAYTEPTIEQEAKFDAEWYVSHSHPTEISKEAAEADWQKSENCRRLEIMDEVYSDETRIEEKKEYISCHIETQKVFLGLVESIRYGQDDEICMVWDGGSYRCASQWDMDNLPVGPDMTREEIELLD